MPATPMIRFRGVGKTFPRTTQPVLNDIDLDVSEGELVALIGPSGCGKSTLLNLLAGLTDASTGTIELGRAELRSAYVFQNPRLLPWRTVARNAEFGLEQSDVGRAERTRRGHRALEMVGLVEHHDKYPHELSGGMQQRAALARGLAIEPALLLLDEPFGALDALTRSYMQEGLTTIVRRLATTTLLVTHDIDEALLLADRVVVLSNRPARIREIFDVPFGREGSLNELLGHPEFIPLRQRIRTLLRPDDLAATTAPRPVEMVDA